MKLYVKNMVSSRCIMLVKAGLKKLGLPYSYVTLGEIELLGDIIVTKRHQLSLALEKIGLELLNDKKDILVERIKNEVVEMVHGPETLFKASFSTYISEKLHHHYNYLSNLFSEIAGTTIEQYIIDHKIERVKELIAYDELNLTEISYMMNYSSVAHLSNQFKKVTGLTPSHFKRLKNKQRRSLEEL